MGREREILPLPSSQGVYRLLRPGAREYACKNSIKPKPTRSKDAPYAMTEHTFGTSMGYMPMRSPIKSLRCIRTQRRHLLEEGGRFLFLPYRSLGASWSENKLRVEPLGYWVVLRCHRIHDVTIISPRQEDTPFYKFGANTLLSVFWMDKQSGQFSIRRVWSVYDYPTDYLSYFDSLIAASALALDDQVVSVGDSFDRVPGLRRIPLSP